MQGDAAVGIGARGAVLEISLDDASHACELAAYLVMPAREKFHLDEVVTLGRAEITVAEPG